MRKIMLLSVMLVFVLVGCSESKVKNTTKNFLNEDKNVMLTENKYVSDVLSKELDEKTNTFMSDMLNSLGIETTMKIKDTKKEYNLLLENVQKIKSKTEYKINNVEVNKNKTNATVLVDIKYVDIGESVVRDISETLDRNVLKSYSGEKIDEEEFLTMAIESLNKKLEEISALEDVELASEKNVKIELIKKDNKWEVKNIDEKMLNASTLNVTKEINNTLKAKLKEVNENRMFLEIETNLRSSFEVIKKLINENEVSYENLKDYNSKITEMLSNIKIVSQVTDKIGDENGVYYIIKGPGESEITITVMNDDKQFTFSEKIQ